MVVDDQKLKWMNLAAKEESVCKNKLDDYSSQIKKLDDNLTQLSDDLHGESMVGGMYEPLYLTTTQTHLQVLHVYSQRTISSGQETALCN